ncbi:MAG: hypothetical protein QF634_09560 [Vicinamibacterales bacterium]|jgi:hypothetical protein|nr:hypothetical protein [Vicinamibacterales bacterium]MDP6663207.1 hypothetical protein [SAR202 cluster bacterium]MDP6801385.1 hypothetical protein [SAR202 cluster bacterium]HJN45336.1 hypothetical protein [Vicinamibacterales bacterium]|tara:strand:- start:545 stop:721 length:177 start_codon:yes stop_codon:yes gene_type:complete
MSTAGESGQTTVEFLMISGLITTMAIVLLDTLGIDDRFQENLREVTEYIIGQVTDPPY